MITLLLFEHTQFGVPIRQSEAQPREVQMPGPDQPLDFRDLPPASFDSCRDRHPFGSDFVERAAITLEAGFLAA
jgi:hypothetical protein